MAAVFGEGITKQVKVCAGRGLNPPGCHQDVLSFLNRWWLEKGKVVKSEKIQCRGRVDTDCWEKEGSWPDHVWVKQKKHGCPVRKGKMGT